MEPLKQLPDGEYTHWLIEEVQPFELPLRAYLSRSLPSQVDVDDLVQDTYVRLLKAKGKRSIRHTKGLLFAIARNLVHDFFRQKNDANVVPITENDAVCVFLGNDENLVEAVCRREELALLTDAINSLPERCREVIMLRKIKGLSQREIAELLGIAEHTVESLAAKGVRRCADYLRAKADCQQPSHDPGP
jgi:RNA polymerase sigma factor (sigma-70 family)